MKKRILKSIVVLSICCGSVAVSTKTTAHAKPSQPLPAPTYDSVYHNGYVSSQFPFEEPGKTVDYRNDSKYNTTSTVISELPGIGGGMYNFMLNLSSNYINVK